MSYLKVIIFACFLITTIACTKKPDTLTDENDVAQLLAMHNNNILAHLNQDIDALLEDAVNDFTLVNRGEVSYPTMEERKNKFEYYFGVTTFDEYKDLISPIVKVSKDGSLGWVIVQVGVSGTQKYVENDSPFQFVSAWIELYEKRNGIWTQIGNVSNFKPD